MTAASSTMAASRCAGQSNNLFVSGQLCPDFLFFCRKFLSIDRQRPYNSVANVVLQMLLAVALAHWAIWGMYVTNSPPLSRYKITVSL